MERSPSKEALINIPAIGKASISPCS